MQNLFGVNIMNKPNIYKLEKACENFNDKFPVGTEVLLKKDFIDEPIMTKVRHSAFVLSGHSAVAFFEGITGCYSISSVIGKT